MMDSDRCWKAHDVITASRSDEWHREQARERRRAITGIDMISNVDGSIHDAGWWRMLVMQWNRDRSVTLRYAYPFEATRIMMRVHHVKHIDPLFTRAQREYMSIAAAQPELSVRETWRLAWHNVRCLDNDHTQVDHE